MWPFVLSVLSGALGAYVYTKGEELSQQIANGGRTDWEYVLEALMELTEKQPESTIGFKAASKENQRVERPLYTKNCKAFEMAYGEGKLILWFYDDERTYVYLTFINKAGQKQQDKKKAKEIRQMLVAEKIIVQQKLASAKPVLHA